MSSWRNPSAEDQAKYNVRPLPEDFEPTAEEQTLLNLYETVKSYERTAARLKEEAARAKLEASQASYNQANAKQESQTKSASREQKRAKKDNDQAGATSGGENENDDAVYSEEEDQDADTPDTSDASVDDEELRHRKKELKLAQLREEVEVKKEQQASKEEQDDHIRQDHLTTKEADDIALIRKNRDYDGPPQGSRLIDNLKATTTPPHDFSSKLELKPMYGKVLFPNNPQSVEDYRWNPPEQVEGPNDGALLVELSEFDISRCQSGGNNTLAVKFSAPEKSKRFSINIASPDHNDFESILFHFNPRQRERGGQLVVNDKQEGIWGSALAVPLSEMPLMFGKESVTLIIQINQEGFDIFVEGKHCARLEHRRELPSGKCDLVLQFPSSDDRRKPEEWTVYKVWWGNRPLMATGDVASVPGANSFNGLHPRKIFVSSLPRLSKQADLDLRRAQLERAFSAYGGARGVTVIVPAKKTYAFIEMESEAATERALRDMSQLYRMNRARRTRHEALQEARAAAAQGGAAAASGGVPGWN